MSWILSFFWELQSEGRTAEELLFGHSLSKVLILKNGNNCQENGTAGVTIERLAEVQFNKSGTGWPTCRGEKSFKRPGYISFLFHRDFYKQQQKPRMFKNKAENSILGFYYKGKGHRIKIGLCPNFTKLQSFLNIIFFRDKHHYG